MKRGKAAGHSEATTEMFLSACDVGVNMLLYVFQNNMQDGTPPEEWGKSITIILFNDKGDGIECGKYRGLRLLEHTMKVLEKVLMRRPDAFVDVNLQQICFASGRSTQDAIFTVRQLQEKYNRKKQSL